MAYLNQTVTLGDGSSASGDTIEGLLYGTLQRGILFADAQAGLLGLEGTAKQYESIYGTEAQGRFNGLGGGGSVRGGVMLHAVGFNIEPSLGLSGLSLTRESLTESQGAGSALDVSGSTLARHWPACSLCCRCRWHAPLRSAT